MSASSWELAHVPLTDLRTGVYPNPRTDLGAGDGSLAALVDSVRMWGVLQPVLAIRTPEGLALITGHRRLAAASECALEAIPALIAPEGLDADDWPLAAALVENLQRKDLNCVEEARALQSLRAQGWTQERIGLLIGKSQAHVSRMLGLLRLPAAVIELLESKRLDVSLAFALLPLLPAKVGASNITHLAQRAVERGATTRQLELAVEQLLAMRGIVPTRTPVPAAAAAAPTLAPTPRAPRPAPKAVLVQEAPAPEPEPEEQDQAPLTREDLLRGLLGRIQSEAKSSGCPACAACSALAGEALDLLAEDRP